MGTIIIVIIWHLRKVALREVIWVTKIDLPLNVKLYKSIYHTYHLIERMLRKTTRILLFFLRSFKLFPLILHCLIIFWIVAFLMCTRIICIQGPLEASGRYYWYYILLMHLVCSSHIAAIILAARLNKFSLYKLLADIIFHCHWRLRPPYLRNIKKRCQGFIYRMHDLKTGINSKC